MMIQRETATHEFDLPHQFRGGVLRNICACTRELADPIHRLELRTPEQASERMRIVTEKGV